MVRNNVLNSIAELEFEVSLYRKKTLDLESKLNNKELEIDSILELIEKNKNQSSEARSITFFSRMFKGKKTKSEEDGINILQAKEKLSELKESEYSLRRELSVAKKKYEQAEHELNSTKNVIRGNLSQQKWKAQDKSFGNADNLVTKQEKMKEEPVKSENVKRQSTKSSSVNDQITSQDNIKKQPTVSENMKSNTDGANATEKTKLPPRKRELQVPKRAPRRRRNPTTDKTEN